MFPTAVADTVPHPSTIYFYVGLDCDSTGNGEAPCVNLGGGGDGLVVVDSGARPLRSLLVRSVHPQVGSFEWETNVVPERDTPASKGTGVGSHVAVTFLGRRDVSIVDIKREVKRLNDDERRRWRGRPEARRPAVLPNEAEAGSNVVLVQVRRSFRCALAWSCSMLVFDGGVSTDVTKSPRRLSSHGIRHHLLYSSWS